MRSETSSAAAEPPSCSPPLAATLTAGCAKAAPAPPSCGPTARSCKPVAASKRSAEPCRCFTESRAPVIMSATDRCDSNDENRTYREQEHYPMTDHSDALGGRLPLA